MKVNITPALVKEPNPDNERAAHTATRAIIKSVISAPGKSSELANKSNLAVVLIIPSK